MMDGAKYCASVPPVVANAAPSLDNPDGSDTRCVPAFVTPGVVFLLTLNGCDGAGIRDARSDERRVSALDQAVHG